ncbi:uncharacterized protein LOC116933793 isoform X1 [Daphnia magna]|uniref:uncharacterized protein LOC116933793 isoform X1 n=1 Tax=Daphnia magna TaxID=35525 RepID=UPI001E1BBF68|nr:uncharacterized protein LOC116933793 isoform X1 [Daphnia magna]
MDFHVTTKVLPKDARWQDLISQLKCPQCQMYQGSSISNLEKHVTLHCKCRPILLKNHYIKKLKQLCAQVHSLEEDVLDYVRLALEAKLLQWRKEGMPEIPFLLKRNDNQPAYSHSTLLDLWRLWHQEVDSVSLEFSISELLQLMVEAESLEWEPCDDTLPPVRLEGDDHQFNLELMSQVAGKLKNMQPSSSSFSEEMDIEEDNIERLEREARIKDT